MASRINLRDPTDIATFLLLLNLVMLSLFGLLDSVLGTLQPYHEEFIGITSSDISTFNPELTILIGAILRSVGLFMLSLAISLLFILNYGFRKKEKWAWYVFLVGLPGLLIPLLVIDYSIVGLFGIPFLAVGIVTIFQILALTISYNDFFKQT